MTCRLSIVAVALVAITAPFASFHARAEELSTPRKIKTIVRNWVIDDEDLREYGLQLDSSWEEADAARNVVFAMHGYQSGRKCSLDLLRPVRDAGFPCGWFDFPNDHSIGESARALSRDLKTFAKAYPDRKVAIVAHSMGGLVARACIEDPKLDPGNVRQLIMIGPPSHGSELARLARGGDILEHRLYSMAKLHKKLKASVVDGLGEAIYDLKPGSDFLDKLNARERNPGVRYSILLGTKAPLHPWEMLGIRQSIRTTTKHIPYLRGQGRKLSSFLAGLDEVVSGKGDGIVAVRRGRLEGVEDTVLLPFEHLNITNRPNSDETRLVREEILERLVDFDEARHSE